MAEAVEVDAADRPPVGDDAPPLDRPPEQTPAAQSPATGGQTTDPSPVPTDPGGDKDGAAAGAPQPPGNHVFAALLVGVWLVVAAISSIAFGASMFNQLDNFPADADGVDLDAWVFWGLRISVAGASRQLHVVALAAAAGVLGGLIFTSRAMASHFADQAFHARWLPWYFIRVVVAGVLGAVVVMAIAAGLITGGTGSSNVEPSGVVAIAFVTGLASKKALAKFKDLVDVFFASAGSNVTNQATQIARIREMAANGEITQADADSLVAKIDD